MQDAINNKTKMFRKWIKTRRAEHWEECVEAKKEAEKIKETKNKCGYKLAEI